MWISSQSDWSALGLRAVLPRAKTPELSARRPRIPSTSDGTNGSIVDVAGCGYEENASRLRDALGGALGLNHTVGHWVSNLHRLPFKANCAKKALRTPVSYTESVHPANNIQWPGSCIILASYWSRGEEVPRFKPRPSQSNLSHL